MVSPENVLLQPVGVPVRFAADVAGVLHRRRRAVIVQAVGTCQVDSEVVLGPLDGFTTD